MAGFTAVSFKTKLEKLSESQQSIQTLSHWVQYHKKAVKESATIWAKEVLRAIPERRLLYIYLANDIMQNSRRKGSEFVQEYGAQMQLVMPNGEKVETNIGVVQGGVTSPTTFAIMIDPLLRKLNGICPTYALADDLVAIC